MQILIFFKNTHNERNIMKSICQKANNSSLFAMANRFDSKI